jgi:hypothetical protein
LVPPVRHLHHALRFKAQQRLLVGNASFGTFQAGTHTAWGAAGLFDIGVLHWSRNGARLAAAMCPFSKEGDMKLAVLFAIGMTAALIPGLAVAQTHGINNEVICAGPGSGMDPRCIGETSPGTWSDFYGAPLYRPYVRPAPQRRR